MKIIAGLGNPGASYETTRHNVGFMAVDHFLEKWSIRSSAQSRDLGLVYTGEHQGEKILLVKPQTFMNRSGRCIGPLFNFFKLQPEDLLVVYDDVDLDLFSLRMKQGGGSGGHNGIKSIDEGVGALNLAYYRIRIGVGRPPQGRATDQHVLDAFSKEELKALPETLDQVSNAVELLLKGRLSDAMNQFHRKNKKEE